jgi:hypothetical protein
MGTLPGREGQKGEEVIGASRSAPAPPLPPSVAAVFPPCARLYRFIRNFGDTTLGGYGPALLEIDVRLGCQGVRPESLLSLFEKPGLAWQPT